MKYTAVTQRAPYMPKFIAVKIHYDHRTSLAPHLKYSTLPTLDEYNEYISLFQDEGIGGNGFHECLNFAIPESGPVKFYLPPTSLPAKEKLGEDFVIFSFTYKGDRVLPAHIVGVHAGAQLLSSEAQGLPRDEGCTIDGIDPLHYHAEAPADLVTLLTPPLEYDNHEGIFTPAYRTWGYGLRYITQKHATNIIAASIKSAELELQKASLSQRTVIQRQIDVLSRIDKTYSLGVIGAGATKSERKCSSAGRLPDKEIGYAGEKLIYDREVAYVRSIGHSPNEVEWISQSVPTSPYDIKTIRKTSDGFRDHFLEVKSSGAIEDTNVYISSGQIDFFEKNEGSSTFVLVKFGSNKEANVRDLTLAELRTEFELVPIKFKLAIRSR